MKSHASDLVETWECVYKDASHKCATVIDSRDLNTIRSRVKHEGLSFLTITLPQLGADFERSLANGRIEPGHFLAFKKRLKAPAFLQGIFARVFDIQTGGLLHEPDIAAIEAVRQLAYVFKKLLVPCSKDREQQAIADFKQCESDLESNTIDDTDRDFVYRVGDVVWGQVFHGGVNLLDGLPKHGPGATRERINGNAKFVHRQWYDRLEPYFPLLETAYSVSAADSMEFERVSVVSEEHELPVRVVLVPKTLKAPRVIAIEPVCMQYVQQQLKSILVTRIENHWMTAGHVNFRDQSVNRSLALSSSIDGRYATLDLSSASDRVRLDHALAMFRLNPDIRDAIEACRSRSAELPTGEIITLRKFASMGSALCFPVEAMLFYTLCIAARLRKRNLPVTSRNVYRMSRDVFIYGDDIIVPVNDVAAVTNLLQAFACKVNSKKSFWTGKFRESCGMDAYDGNDVTPTYVRHLNPRNRRDASAIISLVSASNHFYRRGYWLTSSHLAQRCEQTIGDLPVVGENCSGLGLISFSAKVSNAKTRWNPEYQVNEILTWVPVPVYRKDILDGYGALQKCLLMLESRPPGEFSCESDHLLRSARHGAVALKRRWVRP